MEKKRTFIIRAFGIVIVLSNLICIPWQFLYPKLEFSQFASWINNFIISASVYPEGLASTLALLFSLTPSKLFLPTYYTLWFLWAAIVTICGFGIITLRQRFRKIFVILLTMHIGGIIVDELNKLARVLISFKETDFPWVVFSLNTIFFGLFIPCIYLILFTRPKVKEQFK